MSWWRARPSRIHREKLCSDVIESFLDLGATHDAAVDFGCLSSRRGWKGDGDLVRNWFVHDESDPAFRKIACVSYQRGGSSFDVDHQAFVEANTWMLPAFMGRDHDGVTRFKNRRDETLSGLDLGGMCRGWSRQRI